MKQAFTLLLLSLCALVSAHATIDLKKVYENVDGEIEKWPEYKALRQARIDSLRTVLFTKDINWPDTQYVKCLRLVEEFQSYQNDSAIYYIKCLTTLHHGLHMLRKPRPS